MTNCVLKEKLKPTEKGTKKSMTGCDHERLTSWSLHFQLVDDVLLFVDRGSGVHLSPLRKGSHWPFLSQSSTPLYFEEIHNTPSLPECIQPPLSPWTRYILRVLDQNGVSQACYIVKKHHSGQEPTCACKHIVTTTLCHLTNPRSTFVPPNMLYHLVSHPQPTLFKHKHCANLCLTHSVYTFFSHTTVTSCLLVYIFLHTTNTVSPCVSWTCSLLKFPSLSYLIYPVVWLTVGAPL